MLSLRDTQWTLTIGLKLCCQAGMLLKFCSFCPVRNCVNRGRCGIGNVILGTLVFFINNCSRKRATPNNNVPVLMFQTTWEMTHKTRNYICTQYSFPFKLHITTITDHLIPALFCFLAGSNPLTPDLLSPDDTSMSFSMAPFETLSYQPAATAAASFVISDVTEEEEEEEEDEKDVVSVVSELVPDPVPPVSMTASATFDLDRPSMDFREAEEDTVSLSKSTSFADVMDILKDMNRMKMSQDR